MLHTGARLCALSMSTYLHTPISAMMSTNYSLLAFDPMRSFLARNLQSSSSSNGQLSGQHPASSNSPPSPNSNSSVSQLSPEAAATLAQMQSVSIMTQWTLSFKLNGTFDTIFQSLSLVLSFSICPFIFPFTFVHLIFPSPGRLFFTNYFFSVFYTRHLSNLL